MKCYHFVAAPPYYTNCFLIITDQKHGIAIDPNAAAHYFFDKLSEAGASLTHILLTHGHWDHTGSLNELVKETNAKVYVEKSDATLFNIKADYYYTDNETITIDDVSFNVTTTPGHTPGSVCLRCGEMLFTGDTLFDGDVGRTDLQGGDWDTMLISLKKLCDKITDNPAIYPGHEEFSDMDTQKKYNPSLQF